MILLFALLGCPGTDKGALDSSGTPDDTGPADTATPPCTPAGALFFDLGDTLVAEGTDDLYAAVPGAEELLDALVARGLPLGVITNVPASWSREDLEALLADPSLLDRFDVVLLSSEASAPKPDPVIFEEAVALLPSPPPIETTLFVTEEIEHIADAEPPTEGARAAGMGGVLLSEGDPDPLADHTVAPDALASIAAAPWLDCLEGE